MSQLPRDYLPVPAFDGPSDTRSDTSRRSGGSQPRSQVPGSRSPSDAGRSSGPQGYPKPLGYDPGRERKFGEDFNKNVDLPPEAYVQGKLDTPFARRPGFGSQGKKVGVQVNQFRVLNVPTRDVIQYDVSVNPDTGSASFIKKLWNTPIAQQQLKSNTKYGDMPHTWVFDGHKLAWSRNNVPELRIKVDMDEAKGRAAKQDRNNTFVLIIRRSTVIRLASLKAYLEGKAEWDTHILECMNFFDHVIRQWPSEKLLAIKRNFYDMEKSQPYPLSEPHRIIEGIKGIYAAIRMNSSMLTGGLGLGINVDVANTAFWRGDISMDEFVRNFIWSCKREWDGMPWPNIYKGMRPEFFEDTHNSGRQFVGMSDMFKYLRRLHRLTFTVKHRGKSNDNKVYKIKGFLFDSERYGREGANARNVTFNCNNREISIEQYFKERYGVRLEHWQMPLIETTRAGLFPMECVVINRFQRYNYKLDPDQTSRMIKFAVTRPAQRSQAIMENVRALKWVEDPYLREFGINIKPQMETVGARIIANPKIQFAKKVADPGLRGRWDLRGQTFTGPNIRPLKAWAMIVVNGCVDPPTVQRFAQAFVTSYKGLGGNIVTPQPRCYTLNMERSSATATEIEKYYQAVGNQFQAPPDLFFFILPDKSQVTYERLKKNMDIRLAMVSQMVNCNHVRKAQPQYCANVAMKVNAKLGGYTSRLAGVNFFPAPTMMIGVDVSHGSHGAGGPPTASMAAMTISMNRDATRYAAVCETNGQRVEVLAPARIREMFPDAVRRWCQENKCAPQHVFYFRDGVSEGQFAQVMQYEVEEVRKIIEDIARAKIKITVIVATKRHHIRFFPMGPDGGDNNKNPYPGMVIEHEITHPFHYDFYLCSHVAIQGTARPVHYHILHDEVGMPIDKFQQMIYQQCYQYIRSTTPVSIHPAIYYAHLAAARARAHEAIDISERDPLVRRERMNRPLAKFDNSDTTSNMRPEDVPSLMPIGGFENKAHPKNVEFFKSTMWYI
ncbi:Protein argonaute [Cytospora mali]|uniref:Protein argonaute n=1 Tax=Cytospora mali TaxID=578113 RepID=A0A194UXQ5_CYTMA|nr:Protein argonaute [Valsa mali var. pyri (nom. inval.)]